MAPATKNESSERKTHSFAEAITVNVVDRTDNQFLANIPWDWCGGAHAHGGYLTSLLFSTSKTFFLNKYPSRPQPDPINSHIQFLFPVQIGPARLTVTELSIGKRYSVVQISLEKAKEDTTYQTCAIAIITQGNLSTESGQTIPTLSKTPKAAVPDRDAEFEEFQLPAWMQRLLPVTVKQRSFKRKGGENGQFPSREGLNVRDIWIGWSDETQGYDVVGLGLLCDSFLSAPTNFYNNQEDLNQYVYPTLCLSIEVKKDPGVAKWLLMKVTSHRIANGRFDQEVIVVDEEGGLVCLSKHVSTAVELARRNPKNLTPTRDEGGSRL